MMGWPKSVAKRQAIRDKISRKMIGRHCSPASEFKPGHVPWTKGMKGVHFSRATEFQRWSRPWNWKPVGTLTIRTDSRGVKVKFIKIAEPNHWEYNSREVWRATKGREIPNGCVIYHLNGDQLDDEPRNLVCAPRSVAIKFMIIDYPEENKLRLDKARDRFNKLWEEFRKGGQSPFSIGQGAVND